MAPSSTLLVAAAAVLAVASADEYFTGDGTAYTLGDTSAGNCNFMSALSFASTNYAALNDKQWDGLQNCGRCAEVSCADDRCADQTTTEVVQLLDRCPECAYGDLDLSPTVFTSLTGSDPARYTIKWKFVDCPLSGNVNYCLKGGSNNFWTAVQPTNVATGVSSLQINGQATTMVDSAYYYLLDGASQTQTDLTSMTITLTDVNGNSIEDTVSLTAGSCTEGSHQFPSSAGSSPSTQTYTTTTSAPTTSAPTTSAPTSTPTPTTQTPTPTTVSPAPSLTTAAPTQEQESSPPSVPVSTTSTPATTAPSTTAPSTTAPVATTPQSSPSTGSDATQGAQEESATFNVTATVAPAITSSSGEASTANEADTSVATKATTAPTATPSATAAQTANSQAADDTQSATTKTGTSSSGTDPMIIGMSAFGAVALVALIVVVVVAKKKKIQEQKARDEEAPSMMSVQSFGVQNTPARRQDFAIL